MNRLLALDGLRALSILAVLACHLLPLGPKSLRLNETSGAMGMSLFFSLSGFLITKNLLAGQSPREFFVRRLTRILPLAYLYLFLVFVIFTFDPKALAAGLVFVENYATNYLTLDGHFWSLCVEVHFYLAIGLVVRLFDMRGIILVVPVCFAVTALRVLKGATIDIQTHLRVDEILAGACVAMLYERRILRWQFGATTFAIVAGFWFIASSPQSGWIQYARPYSSAMLLATSLMLEDSWLFSVLASRPARYVAEISYALYVIHPATVWGWMNEGPPVQRYLLKRPLSFMATFALSHLSTFYFERRWIEFGKSLVKRKAIVT
jgi:peptidoglycan/LPS O-acetylase OafA/YrhL